ncbi:RICIN domain-containing protein [Streptomyces flavotricini]|uniref:RICIN domain-containing protein n=2 Tax=Streptomyces TaxID=1883 RepID=A0ABS8E087_9ACTN|nr:RICIN domain-containing protein [Streptomyces flavotricini]
MMHKGGRRWLRAVMVFGTALSSCLWVFSGPAQAQGIPLAGGSFFLIKPMHANGTRCLDVSNASGEDGTPVVSARCWGGSNQLWTTRLRGAGYEIAPLHSSYLNMCLAVSHFHMWNERASVVQEKCSGRNNQIWRFFSVDNGAEVNVRRPAVGQFVEFRSVVSGKCMDVAHMSLAHGAPVVQAGCWNGANQRWVVTALTNEGGG